MIIATGQPVTAALLRSIYGTDWDTWTPTIGGGGTATFSAGGRWRRIGEKTVTFTVNLSVTGVGSGAAPLSFTLPTPPARSRRWIFVGGHELGGIRNGLYGVTFTSGTGNVVDRLRYNGSTNLTGADMTVGMLIQFTGTYEEA